MTMTEQATYSSSVQMDLRDVSKQLGDFRAALVGQGIPEDHANAMVLQVFAAYLDGRLMHLGLTPGSFR